jgi:hypothetical protein
VSGIDNPKASGTYRAALAAVIILSVLVVLALIAVAAGFVRQYRLHLAASSGGGAPAAGAAASITLAPGARILSAGADSGKLVLHLQTEAGGEVDIFDFASGRITARIKEDQAKGDKP